LTYLLDTNTWVALLRWQDAGVLARLKQVLPENIVLCSIVLAELWYGAEHSGPQYRNHNHQLVDGLAAKYDSLPFDNAAAREYAVIREQLAHTGQPIGPHDTMIAAIARSRGVTVVTHNTGEFGRVPSLNVEDWRTA
jgi:tRNA(fMet)-specific endonuclease VapC